jgi:hypothetical protein
MQQKCWVFVLVLGLISLLAFSNPVSAKSFYFSNVNIDYLFNNDATISVTEELTFNFLA